MLGNDTNHGELFETINVVLQWIIITFTCESLNLFGIVTNIINIMCFVKQGFKDPVNVSLVGLAVADIGCLVFLTWTCICCTPAFAAADMPFDTIQIQYLTGGILQTTFARISAWITAVIALERCLCITVPLKVKSLITSRREMILMVCIFIVLIASVAPVYVVNRLGIRSVKGQNKTIIGLVFTEDREKVEQVSFTINNVFIPMSSFVIILICTVTLAIKLKKSAEWRKSISSIKQTDCVSNRNQRTAQMVIVISILFVACYFPFSMIFLAMALEPEFSLDGKYRNILVTVAGLGSVLNSINSSSNIFIYYRMSSKYRSTFHQMFHRDSNSGI